MLSKNMISQKLMLPRKRKSSAVLMDIKDKCYDDLCDDKLRRKMPKIVLARLPSWMISNNKIFNTRRIQDSRGVLKGEESDKSRKQSSDTSLNNEPFNSESVTRLATTNDISGSSFINGINYLSPNRNSPVDDNRVLLTDISTPNATEACCDSTANKIELNTNEEKFHMNITISKDEVPIDPEAGMMGNICNDLPAQLMESSDINLSVTSINSLPVISIDLSEDSTRIDKCDLSSFDVITDSKTLSINNDIFNDKISTNDGTSTKGDACSDFTTQPIDINQLTNLANSSSMILSKFSKNSSSTEKIDCSSISVITNTETSPTKLVDNDKLVQMNCIPLDLESIPIIRIDEEEMVNWDVQYDISPNLGYILSQGLIEIPTDQMRQNTDEHNSVELSPVILRPRNSGLQIKYMDNSSTLNSSENDIDESNSHLDESFSIRDNEQSNGKLSVELDPPSLPDDHSPLGISSKSQKNACDNSNLIVKSSNEPKTSKKYCCLYCHKKVCKLPRHLETVHHDKEEVKKFMNLAKGCKEREEIITVLRNKGNFEHNTNAMYNDGELIVSRRPNVKYIKKGYDYKTCANCLNTYSITNIRHHTAKCLPKDLKGQRTVLVLGKTIEGRLHSNASDKLRLEVFPVMREDAIVRCIRYDWLLIIYGNKLCMKFIAHYQHNMIRRRLRLLGGFLLTVKGINPDVTDMASLYAPKYYDSVVEGIRKMTGFSSQRIDCDKPDMALNLSTYIKELGKHLKAEYIKLDDPDKQMKVNQFLKLHSTDMPFTVNKVAAESKALRKRKKKTVLPITDDINLLIKYIDQQRKECFKKLSEKFDYDEWRRGLELCAAYLVVFNRRRVGEIQNILVDEYRARERIDKEIDKEIYHNLNNDDKLIVQKYERLEIRGKKGRPVPVLITPQLVQHTDLLMSYREKYGVPDDNIFLFALSRSSEKRQKVLDLCTLMRKFSKACGAKNPETLRCTQLRKHIATKCDEWELSENVVADLANFMGHAEKIHRDIYRQPIKARDITRISRLLESARGQDDDESDDEEGGENDYEEKSAHDDVRKLVKDAEQNDGNNDAKDSEIEDDLSTAENFLQNLDLVSNSSIDGISNTFVKTSSNTSNHESIEQNDSFVKEKSVVHERNTRSENVEPKNHSKRRWTKAEKDAIMKNFQKNIQLGILPTFDDIRAAKKKEIGLKNRSSPQIKSWIHNQIRSKCRKSNPTIRSIENVQIKLPMFRKKMKAIE